MNKDLFSRSGLSLDRLRSFLEVAEVGSIAKSAPDSLSRQAQVSRQIGELETYFETELTVRRGKTIALSPAGERLAVLVRQQFDDLQGFINEQRKLPRTFRIGAGASMLEWMVIPAAGGIREVLGNAALNLKAMRSRELVEAVRDGAVDFAVVREDALSEEQRAKTSLPVARLSFHLCVARSLLGTRPRSWLAQSAQWTALPWAAMAGGGQLDQKVRQAVEAACGRFAPAVECTSLLQVRELVVCGACAGVLPSIGLKQLAEEQVLSREFEPLKHYGRPLVLHWNDRQMRRRGIERVVLEQLASHLAHPARKVT